MTAFDVEIDQGEQEEAAGNKVAFTQLQKKFRYIDIFIKLK